MTVVKEFNVQKMNCSSKELFHFQGMDVMKSARKTILHVAILL